MFTTNIVAVEAAGSECECVRGLLVNIKKVGVVALICVGAVSIESEPPPIALYTRVNIARGGIFRAGGDTRNIGPTQIAACQLVNVAARLGLALGDGYGFGKYFVDIVEISRVCNFNTQSRGLCVAICVFYRNRKSVDSFIHAG